MSGEGTEQVHPGYNEDRFCIAMKHSCYKIIPVN